MVKRVGPCLYITGLPRTTTKEFWKWFYRFQRVTLRETEKAGVDMMLYGSGYVQYNLGEDPKHIPIEQVRLWA